MVLRVNKYLKRIQKQQKMKKIFFITFLFLATTVYSFNPKQVATIYID